MKKLVKPISIVLTIAYLLLIPLSSFAAIGTSGTNSDNTLLSKWKGYGILDSSTNSSDLNKPIQKIDFITYLNDILKTSKQADIGFNDVPKGSWYSTEIAKAVAAGYVVNKDKSNFYPFANITRLDAAIMVAHVFGLKLSNKDLLNRITDAEKLNAEQLADFGAVIEKGCLSETSKGKYAPSGVLKLIDALKMLDKCIGQLVTKAGTISKDVSGDMIINAGSVTLKNMTVSGDLTIGEGVGEGAVRLDGVSVKGKMTIRGGGPNSVTLFNTNLAGSLFVEKSAGNVNVVASGKTTVEETYLKSGGSLRESNITSGKGFYNVTAERAVIDNQTANLEGSFNNIEMQDSNINIKLEGNSEKVNISENNAADFTQTDGTTKSISTKASKNNLIFTGGTVEKLVVEADARGNKITIDGDAAISTITLNSNTTFDFEDGNIDELNLEPTSEGSYLYLGKGAYLEKIVADAGVKVEGYGSIELAYINADNVSMDIKPDSYHVVSGIETDIAGISFDYSKDDVVIYAEDEITVQAGDTEDINADASPDDTNLKYVSSDSTIATVDGDGEITGVSVGTTTIYITGKMSGYNSAVKPVEVNVTSNNITAAGTLAISPETGEAGTTEDFEIKYTAGDDMSNGTVVIKLPAGFSVYESDTVSIDEGAETNLTSSQLPNKQTLSLTNLDLSATDTIVVYLRDREVPAGGQYEFTAISDADATGPKLPISGKEKAIFTSDSLRELVEGENYSTPVPGSTGGTTKISTLSFRGFTGATNWLIKVQDGAFTEPKFDDVITGTGYKENDDISVVEGQHLMLAAVDVSNKVKAYRDITITSAMIRLYSAGGLVPDKNYSTPETGIRANAVRITSLNLTDITGAAKWMYKVSDTATSDVYVDTKFEGAQEYTAGDDILVTANQHILLAATDSSGNVKAYADIRVTSDMISTAAGSLELDNNYTAPTYGEKIGNTKIESLTKGDATGGFAGIDKWMLVVLGNEPVTPALDVSTTEFGKYTEGKTFSEYTAGDDIAVSVGNHLLLVGVEENGSTNSIKAYADITITSAQVRQESAPEIPDINYSAPVIGSTAGTTQFSDLNFNTSSTGTTIPTDATKYMVKVQDDALVAAPQVNSTLSGAGDCAENQNIAITAGQHLILLATDANGKIKAYKDIEVSASQIRPADALKLLTPNDYTKPAAGSAEGTTMIVLSANGISNFAGWQYLIKDSAFEIPYKGSILNGTTYTSGADIPVSVGQHILIIAVDVDGKTLAYTDETISASQIKQPKAGILTSTNYSDPEPGQVGGTTRITTLSTFGIQGATKWLYKISDTDVSTPDYNSVLSGLLSYIAGDSIAVTEGQHFILYAADNSNRIKAYKDITISSSQIRTPAATLLVSQTNYAVPTPGGSQGTTMISSLSFAGLDGSASAWSWKYAVGNTIFSAPTKDSSASAISGTYELTTSTAITVNAGQYILLLAVDGSNAIKGYANIYVYSTYIHPYNAAVIPATSYNLTKGTSAGTTCFDKLDLISLTGATNWRIKTQKTGFDIPAKDVAVSGSNAYTLGSNITIETGGHILLLATDSLNRVKAYADITVTSDKIKAPYATLLTENTNYTAPEPGSSDGTTKITLSDTGIDKAAGETVVWKYKTSTEAFDIPLLGGDASGYTAYTSEGNIPVKAGDYVLIVAAINEKIIAYKQFNISASQINPTDAPELVLNTNYTVPQPGSAPGTTKVTGLKLISIVGGATKWQMKVSDTEVDFTYDSVFTNPINYTSGDDIEVKENQYVVLAAVDASGRVKAYKNLQITESQINPPLADKLVSGLNYNTPKYGTKTGTTSIYVSAQGINGCTGFVAKVVSTSNNIIAGSKISYTTGSGIDFTDFHTYTSGSDIAVSEGQYVLLIAVDSSNNALAYENIEISESSIRPGDATLLATPANYSKLEPGSGVGTTKFTTLTFVGVPVPVEKWIVKVQDNDLAEAPLINTSVAGATAYEVNKDIAVKEGQYVVLYAVDSTSKIKGYVSIPVTAENIRGAAAQLQLDTNYSAPEPGSTLNTTKIATLKNLPTGATQWKYIVQDSAASTILKDSTLTGLTTYTSGDISAKEGQHLILVATDNSGYIKAYADITLTANNIRNVEAALSGTIISSPTGESDIAAGGRTVIIKLAYGVWQDDVITNTTKRNDLFDGFTASGDEQAQWSKVITALKAEGASAAVMNSTKDTITITLSEATYDITKTQEISLTIAPELIKNGIKAATASNTIKIAANVTVTLDGTAITPGIGEGDILAGGKTIIINLTNGQFALDVASNEAKRNAIFDGFKTSNDDTDMWDKVIAALKAAGEAAITRNTSSKITIKLQAVSDYNISMNETISLTLPYMTTSSGATEEILVGAINEAKASNKITIAANASADLSGSLITSAVSETNIITGGKQLIITLTDGQWVTDIKTTQAKRDALFAGLVTSSTIAADKTAWAKVVTALQTAGQDAIKRESNNTVTITLPAVSGYNITSSQYVTLTIPSTCIIGGTANMIAGQTIKIGTVATAKLTGTAVASTVDEAGIRLGGKTVIITLTGATWADGITTDTTIKNALFDGFVADVESTQWAKVVAALKSSGTIAKTSATVITITLPSADYDITAAVQTITVTVPTCAAIGTSFEIPATNTIAIKYTAPTATKITGVSGPTGTYKQGDVIPITVTFQDAVDVIGTPVINLETGTNDRDAVYYSGSGNNILVFNYTVQSGDTSQKLTYKATSSLVLTGASIKNKGTSVSATLTLPALTATNAISASNICIDAVAPAFSTGYPKAGTITDKTANILVKVNEAGTIYYVTLLKGAASPSLNQIIAGTDSTDNTALAKGTLPVVLNTEGTLLVNTGLTEYTDYTVYMVAVDSVGNKGSVTALNFKTTDITPPKFNTNPKQLTPTSDNLISVVANTNEAGNIYMIALPAGSQAPTSDQVAAAKDASGTAVATNLKASASVIKDTDVTLQVTGLTVSTKYDIYVVCVDSSGNIIDTPATFEAETSKLNMDNVGVNLAKSMLTNTTTQMEYSFDGQVWKSCTATSTNITYDDNAQILTIYIREAANITNTRAPLIITRGDESVIKISLIEYDIAAQKITNTNTNADSTVLSLQYRISGGAWKALNASAANVAFASGLLEVRTAATEANLPSAPVTVDNIAVPMPAPNLIYDDYSNEIKGLNSTYEYRIDGGSWINGIVEGDFAGTKKVEVREKATKEKLPSTAKEILFTACALKAVASPAAADATLNKNFVTITFEENTNQKIITIDDFKKWFKVGKVWNDSLKVFTDSREWGDILQPKWTAGNVLTVEYNSMTVSPVIGDEVRILADAGITNTEGTSGSYTSKGTLAGSFHTIPAIESVTAVNGDGKIYFGNGDKLVITFDQLTKEPIITKDNIYTYLEVAGSTTGENKWGVISDSDIVWSKNIDGTKSILTITFNDVTKTKLTLSDKITVSTSLGLTDADGTTEACNSSSYISGSFTSTPEIVDAVISNGGTSGKVDAGDTITITFDQATNKKTITSSMLINYFKLLATDKKTTHSWGVQNTITWTDDKTLTITLSNMTGVTLVPGDTLTLNASAGIKSADGGTSACDDSYVIEKDASY